MIKNHFSIIFLLLLYSCGEATVKCDYAFEVRNPSDSVKIIEKGKVTVINNQFTYTKISNSETEYFYQFRIENEKVLFSSPAVFLECFVIDQFDNEEFFSYSNDHEKVIISKRFGLVAMKSEIPENIVLLDKVCKTNFNADSKTIFTTKLTDD